MPPGRSVTLMTRMPFGAAEASLMKVSASDDGVVAPQNQFRGADKLAFGER